MRKVWIAAAAWGALAGAARAEGPVAPGPVPPGASVVGEALGARMLAFRGYARPPVRMEAARPFRPRRGPWRA